MFKNCMLYLDYVKGLYLEVKIVPLLAHLW